MDEKILNPKDAKPRKKITPKQREARSRNIAQYRESVGGATALKSGVFTAIRSRGAELPPVPGARQIAADADALVLQMVSDLGYDRVEDVPAAKRAILESQRLNLLVLGLANRFLRSNGVLNRKNGKPNSILTVCVSFSNSLRHNALALGLERVPRRVGPSSLAEYLESRTAETPKPPQVPSSDEPNPGSPELVP